VTVSLFVKSWHTSTEKMQRGVHIRGRKDKSVANSNPNPNANPNPKLVWRPKSSAGHMYNVNKALEALRRDSRVPSTYLFNAEAIVDGDPVEVSQNLIPTHTT